ncbi:hypothetical protein V1264_014200 [Littorina saxatilis]
MSVEELQKSLEDIKWDTDASIKKKQIEELENHDESSQDVDAGDLKFGDVLSEMQSIEDIYFDDDIKIHLPHSEKKAKGKHKVKGTPDPSVPASDVPCSGCGATLHCQDPILPGYLPNEKFKCLTREEMRTSFCQRCFLINVHNMFLDVQVSAETYPQILKEIRTTRALVVVVIDLFDMKNSVFKDLFKYIGRKPLFIVGNKVDIIPQDRPGYLQRTKEALLDVCESAGLNPADRNVLHVCMVSAKTGYGIENLITKLMTAWKLEGHVYVVGSTNVGKSTLFNALLMSDYCKAVARGFINRATVSVWPGTTLNLLKFPIMNPASWRLMLRAKRLAKDETRFRDEEAVRKSRLSDKGSFRAAILTGHLGLTDFRSAQKIAEDEAEAERYTSGQQVVSFAQATDGSVEEISGQHRLGSGPKGPGYQPERFNMHWCHDTPGVVNPEQVINLLEPEELATVLPRSLVQPQCVVVKPGQVLFVTGMGRIDFVEGNKSIYLTAHVAQPVKLHVKDKEEADEFYCDNLGTSTLGVPLGDAERLSKIPSLVGREFQITGVDWDTAAADIQLSSIGWVAVTAGRGMAVTVRAYTPGGRGVHLRSPALLPSYAYFRGKRRGKTPYYRVQTPKLF